MGVVIDLSGGHRLKDASLLRPVVRLGPSAAGRARALVYGLPELSPASGRLVANPGCYATASLLALHPIRDAIDPARS